MTENYPNPYEQPNPYGGGPETRSYDANPLKSQAIKGGVLIAIFAVGVLIVGGAIKSKIFTETHEWLNPYKAEGRASKDGK